MTYPLQGQPAGGGYTEGAHVTHDANQAVPNNTDVTLAFNTERFDTDSTHDNVTNNSRLTCQTAGKYLILAMVRFTTNSTGNRIIKIRLNGTTVIAQVAVAPTPSHQAHIHASIVWDLSASDYVEVAVRQLSGITLYAEKDLERAPEFMMQRIG